MRKTDLKLILPNPSSWSDLTTIKQRRDRRKLFYGGDTISVLMSPSENKSLHILKFEDTDTVVVVCIFNRDAMERMVSPYHLTVAGEEEGETNP